jgi:hypothetical protein
MLSVRTFGVLIALTVAFGVGLFARGGVAARDGEAREEKAACPRYTVVHTEALNLIVTDNRTNTLYFYAIDEGQEVGADLKLRGSVDLNKVGEPVLHPVRTRAKK